MKIYVGVRQFRYVGCQGRLEEVCGIYTGKTVIVMYIDCVFVVGQALFQKLSM